MSEEWKDIKGFIQNNKCSKKEISNLGNIRSTYKNGRITVNNGTPNYAGYKVFDINKKQFRVNRLVYQHFVGEIPEGKDIDHINNIRDDNRLVNLQPLTPSDNSKKKMGNKKKVGYCRKKSGKFTFDYRINNVKYLQSFYSKEERDELQKLYIELVKIGLIV